MLPKGILPSVKFTARLILALSYIGNVTVRHSSSGRQPNFAALSRGPPATYIRQGGHHIGHPPSFLLYFVLMIFYSSSDSNPAIASILYCSCARVYFETKFSFKNKKNKLNWWLRFQPLRHFMWYQLLSKYFLP